MTPKKLTIMALDDKHYLRLRKRHPNIRIRDLRHSAGLAIPKENVAYVRLTPDYEENQDTYRHEMEELLANRSQHEINGVRYKKQFWKKVSRAISGIGKSIEKTFILPSKSKLAPAACSPSLKVQS